MVRVEVVVAVVQMGVAWVVVMVAAWRWRWRQGWAARHLHLRRHPLDRPRRHVLHVLQLEERAVDPDVPRQDVLLVLRQRREQDEL